ncbi:MAG: FtsX-like permease family protein [Burkholderiales bacterium]|nr:MAG: FtsX-like permease family protein [Betaproteobacteria bacterium]TAG78104.1 MAG: FtsX-like permease family protein [Burkholderiales bacterium]
MKIPFTYIARNLWTRRLTTALTASGMALVVFVFAAVLMLDAGLKKTLVGTGSWDNAILLRQGAQTEIQSGVSRDQAALIETLTEVARDAQGRPLSSKEIVVLIGAPKKGDTKPQNVIVRGLAPVGIDLRPQVKIQEGRWFQPGASEIVVGKSVNAGFANMAVGDTIRFAARDWRIVGVFDGQSSGFDSEAWGDVEQLGQAFRRVAYSSMVVKLVDDDALSRLQKAIEGDVRLKLDVKAEPAFYEEQSKALSTFLSILGLTLSIIFSIGAVIGAAITMYSSVASRIGEIGTLRALGFRRASILVAFLGESLLLALVGGLIGLIAASFLQLFTVSTLNFASFSQLAFGFYLTPAIVIQSLIFAIGMGFIGGFLPSFKAARMEIVDSLRAG